MSDLPPTQREAKPPPAPEPEESSVFRRGQTIGPYTLRNLLGAGGFGEVWRAERRQPDMTVAIKVLLPHRTDRESRARFEAERQALARLDHPYIAKILDAGVTDKDSPYLVMEYVQGVRINEFCDHEQLSQDERLELIAKVCEGVHAAHTQGIIHRDLKPGNILVVSHERREGDSASESGPIPKIVDFGIAKAVNANMRLSDQTLTIDLNRAVGTPEYMAPEQAEATQGGVDTRSDIYAVGVILYELLVGALPLSSDELRRMAIEAIAAKLRAGLPEPSTRFSKLDAQSKADSSERRGRMSQAQLGRWLQGRARHLPMKATRPDRAKRFSSAAAMAADIRNYLTNRDYREAAAEPWWDKTKRFVGRNQLGVGAAAVLLLTLTAGLVVTGVLLKQTHAAKEEASTQRDKATSLAEKEKAARVDADRQRVEAEAAKEEAEWQGYKGNLEAAEFALRLGEKARVVQARLEPIRESFSDTPEWKFLWAASDQSSRTVQVDEGPVHSVRLANDGHSVIATTRSGRVLMWDPGAGADNEEGEDGPNVKVMGEAHPEIHTFWTAAPGKGNELLLGAGSRGAKMVDKNGKTAAELGAQDSWIACLAVTADGGRAIAARFDGSVQLWDVSGKEGKLLQALPRMGGPVRALAVAGTSTQGVGATGSTVGELQLWNLASGEQIAPLVGHGPAELTALTFAPSGKLLWSGDARGGCGVWRENGAGWAGKVAPQVGAVGAICPLGDDRAAFGFGDGHVSVIDIGGAIVRGGVERQTGAITCIALVGTGLIATGSTDGTVVLWRVDDLSLVRRLRGHNGAVTSMVVTSDGGLLTASADGSVKAWDIAELARPMTLGPCSEAVSALCIGPDGGTVITGTANGDVEWWDLSDRTKIGSIKAHRAPITKIVLDREGRRMACGAADGTVTVWDAWSAAAIAPGPGAVWQAGSAAVEDMAFGVSQDSLHAAFGDGKAFVLAYETRTASEVRVQASGDTEEDRPTAGVWGFADSGGARMWAAKGQFRMFRNSGPERTVEGDWESLALDPESVVISRGGDFAAVSARGSILLKGFEDGAEEPEPIQGRVLAACDGPEGMARLLVAAPTGEVALVNWANGGRVLTLAQPVNETRVGVAAPDAGVILTGGQSATVHIWELDPPTSRSAGLRDGRAQDAEAQSLVEDVCSRITNQSDWSKALTAAMGREPDHALRQRAVIALLRRGIARSAAAASVR